MSHSSVSVAVFWLLLLNLCQLLRYQVPVCPHCLIQRLLFFELWLCFHVLFLEFCYEIVSQLYFITGIEIFGLCWGSLERVCIPFFFERSDLLVEFLDFFLLTEKFILFFLEDFFLVDNLFIDFFVVSLWPLKFLFVHISISFKFFNKTFVFGWIFLLFVDFSLELHQTHVNWLLEFLYLLLFIFEGHDFLLNGWESFPQRLLFWQFPRHFFPETLKLFVLLPGEFLHRCIDFFNLA